MIGQQVFDQMVNETTAVRTTVATHISQQDFETWQQDYTWDALHGIRYAQSFCNRFGITDHVLYYTNSSLEQIDQYIQEHYIGE
jgi:hypothetical protein